jgi:hypothetical protein
LKVKICESNLIYELIDEEIVILNFINGNYFTLDGIGVYFWELILKSGDSELITEHIYNFYKREIRKEIIEKTVIDFINEFITEGLVTPINGNIMNTNLQGIALNFKETVIGIPDFSTLTLHSYRDFQEKFTYPCGIKRSDE